MDTFDEIDHTADWALRVRGATLPELFINAAQGMYALTIDGHAAPPTQTVEIEATGIDPEALLVNWLNALVYYTEVDDLVFEQFELVEFAPDHLRAVARGAVGVPLRKHIKAVTFHDLKIIPTADGYEVTIVFDV